MLPDVVLIGGFQIFHIDSSSISFIHNLILAIFPICILKLELHLIVDAVLF